MTLINILDFVSFAGAIPGAILIGFKVKEAFLWYILGSSASAWLAVINCNPWTLATCVIFIILDVIYYIKWRNEAKLTKLNKDAILAVEE